MGELQFHPAARAEAVAAAIYLEHERIGYGDKFDAELADVCERIALYPHSGSKLSIGRSELVVRAHPMKTFRYSLIVALADETAIVYAVAHHGRRPGYWSDRLR